MKTNKTTQIAVAAIASASFLTLTSCDVDVVEEGEMPKVEVTEGKLPKIDVDVADVEAGLKEVEVEVPKVKMEKETIKVPVVGIEPPKDDDKENPNKTEEEEGQ